MPRIDPELQRLQEIKTLPSLIKYLKEDLNWPIGSDDVEDVVYDYDPSELGFDSASTAKIEEVCQLRPLTPGQKWGVFWVKFGKKQLPVQMLRRALGNLVVKKRTSTKKADKAAWHMHDLLFISAYGDDSNRHITFAHFSESEDSQKSLPILKVLGWDEDDTLLHLKDTYKTLVDCLNWETTPTDDPEAWREHWSKAFKLTHKEVINTTKELVVELAHLATVIKKSVLTSINAETEKGPWKKLMLAFQKTLIKDLNEAQFADVIAQTVSYGLLTARLSSDGQISLKNLVDMVPSTNPFLKELLQHFLTSAGMKGLFDVDEAGINDVVELLNRANAQAIRNDFGKKTDGEDPVIHFYEHFLGAYNKKLKVERGVFYTPKPIVSYIVRSVHELLQKEYGLEDGLADTSTWAEVKDRYKDLKIPEGIKPDIEPFVQILDPATGTATFLIEVIDVIHNAMTAKWDKQRVSKAEQVKKWNTYVPTHLLPRLYAYELMMAPYAIAHMKVGLKLTETGFTAWDKLGPENRANIYLTNALEPWVEQLDLPGFEALAHEASAVNKVKRETYFSVIIGNPPYSNFGQLNKNSFILGLLDDYKRELNEKKINLDDDFIKFFRLSQYLAENSSEAVVGLITSNTFLDGLTHRRMRASLTESFSEIIVSNLHGNIRKKEKTPTGEQDENVFEIQQGVSINLLIKSERAKSHNKSCKLSAKDIWGSRSHKYDALKGSSCRSTGYATVNYGPPYWLFVPQDTTQLAEYEGYMSLHDVFNHYSSGIQTKRDALTIQHTQEEAREVMRDMTSLTIDEIRSKYSLPEDGRDWTISDAIADISKNSPRIVDVLYRPFDVRKTLWTGKTKGFLGYPRNDTMKHMLRPNIGLCIKRQMQDLNWSYIFASKMIVESAVHFSTPSNPHFFPLYFYTEEEKPHGLFSRILQLKEHNLCKKAIDATSIATSLKFVPSGHGDLVGSFGPDDLLNYIYAVLHSTNYRTRYAEFLKMDFPRIPVPSSLSLFEKMCKIGNRILTLHTFDSPLLKNSPVSFSTRNTIEIEKPSWSNNTAWVDKAQTIGFKGVDADVWKFHIGGYQVCEKWLKDRKGRKLTMEDIKHYQRIVVAISETIRLMAEIDKVVDEHGGWPGAFQAAK